MNEHRSPSMAMNPEYLSAGSPFVSNAVVPSLSSSVVLNPPPPLPIVADDSAASPYLMQQNKFPLPLSPAAKPTSVEVINHSPLKSPPNPFTDAPEPPPFLVTVSYATAESWTIDSKHRVVSGTTVFSLIEQCVHQLEARHALVLSPDDLCLRVNHETARRSVMLASDRVLHSFSFFQKMQRENVPIVLYLSKRDCLRDAVQQRLKQMDKFQLTAEM